MPIINVFHVSVCPVVYRVLLGVGKYEFSRAVCTTWQAVPEVPVGSRAAEGTVVFGWR